MPVPPSVNCRSGSAAVGAQDAAGVSLKRLDCRLWKWDLFHQKRIEKDCQDQDNQVQGASFWVRFCT